MEISNMNKTSIKNDFEEKNQILTSVNTNNSFQIDINFTDYNKHIIIIKISRIYHSYYDKPYLDKSFIETYDLGDLLELSPYFKKLGNILDIFKEIKKTIKDGLYDLFENKKGIALILTISNFIDYKYKIPFLLLEDNNENNKTNFNQSLKDRNTFEQDSKNKNEENQINENIITDNKKEVDNINPNIILRNKRLRSQGGKNILKMKNNLKVEDKKSNNEINSSDEAENEIIGGEH